MTKTEQAELQELGLTPEALKAKQQALASMTAQAQAANGRKRRSDAGTKRPKPSAAPSGTISPEQADDLRGLVVEVQQRERDKREADAALRDAVARFNRMLDELQGKR